MTWPTKDDFADGDVLTAAQVNNIADNLNLYDPTSATIGQVPIADGAGSVAFGTPAGGATEIMIPTAAVVGAGTATINANGSVSFSNVTSLALEGVFTSAHENYMILMTVAPAASITSIQCRLRSGSTNTTGTSWQNQNMKANSTTVSAAGASNQLTFEMITLPANANDRNSLIMYVFAPQQSTYTKTQAFAQGRDSSNYQIVYTGGLWNTTDSYDGIAWTNIVGDLTGDVTVYGFKD